MTSEEEITAMKKQTKKQLWYIVAVAAGPFVATQFGPSLVRYINMKRM